MSETAQSPPLTGGCQCGAVRYEITNPPRALFVCHCLECRKQSASAFGITVSVAREAFRIVHGAVKSWSRDTDQGNRLDCHFCPECGTRIWHENAPDTEHVSLKGGSLDDGTDLAGAIHIWTARKLPGVVIPPGAECYPGEPPD